ncbi:MAG: hypothetical protein ACI9CF_000526 [Candidatus Omnitrophota bacterium]|jgi:hypothetical protein
MRYYAERSDIIMLQIKLFCEIPVCRQAGSRLEKHQAQDDGLEKHQAQDD